MGIYDRDYYRQSTPASAFGGVRMWSVNTWLIAINIAVFVLNNLLTQNVYDPDGYLAFRQHPISDLGYFSVATAVYHLQVWRFITFQFLHAGLNHILFNMIALFFFGQIIEAYLGSRRYLAFYLLCGVGGAILYIILWTLGALDQRAGMSMLIHNADVHLVGASAGIFGVLIAAAIIAPETTVLVWGIIPVRLKVLAWVALAWAVYTVVIQGENAGGEAAHLGGAVAGFLLIRNPRVLQVFDFRRRPNIRYRP